jgi:hypothetical protein
VVAAVVGEASGGSWVTGGWAHSGVWVAAMTDVASNGIWVPVVTGEAVARFALSLTHTLIPSRSRQCLCYLPTS